MCHQARGPGLDLQPLGREILSLPTLLRALPGAVGDGDVQENGTTPAWFIRGDEEALVL